MSYDSLLAQNDSIPLRVERLSEGDILTKKEVEKGTIVQSSTRSEVDIYDQSNTVFVVTSDDILKNGWNTLGEVLRHVPGVQVSQPGSALEGDVFMMRGNRGNSEAIILINDVPIRPSGGAGMPLGAQLPIRQAERIEVLFGGGGAFFGENEAGGIINIILKETERPIFTQADLSFGKNNYNSLDLFFGGKIGRDKNIFRFGIYGSSTILGDRALYHDDQKEALFDAQNYLLSWQDSLFYQTPENFKGKLDKNNVETSRPNLSKTPHESRLFGLNLRWHGVHFTYNRMYRRDHSALGLSPLAVSYANSQNYIGEQIETFSLGARRVRERGGFYYTLSSVLYRMDERSTTAWVMPMIGTAFFAHTDPDHALAGPDLGQKIRDLDNQYFSGERYSASISTDFRQEIRWNRRLGEAFQLQFGQTTNVNRGRPVAHFSRQSSQGLGFLRNRSAFFSPTFSDERATFGALSGWAELVFVKKRGQISVGEQFNLVNQAGFNTKISGFFNVNNWLQLRTNMAERAHYEPLFRDFQTLQYKTFTAVQIDNNFNINANSPSRTRAVEAGVRFRKLSWVSLDAHVFWQKTDQISANGYFLRQQPPFILGETASSQYGWFADPAAFRVVSGLLIFGKTTPISIDFTIFKKEIMFDWTQEFSFAQQKGKFRAPAQSVVQNRVPGLSSLLLKYQTTFSWPKTQILAHFNHVGATPNWEGFWKNQWQRPTSSTENERYSTVDLTFRRTLSSNFQVYFFVNNVLNRHFAGLDATGSPDDLRFNPQSGRVLRLGINYNMN